MICKCEQTALEALFIVELLVLTAGEPGNCFWSIATQSVNAEPGGKENERHEARAAFMFSQTPCGGLGGMLGTSLGRGWGRRVGRIRLARCLQRRERQTVHRRIYVAG